ncbi:hypothetical protein KKG55_00025 [Candidatus Micrarchaeota archaeon]|nr:hypothetical protein [Candidatus Micrarchaeota archaeon]MBU1886092.1 hypothetical protein [Candidatus Micrarchaeota archaeon]
MVSRRGLLFGNRGEKPQGDITNSETTRHGFRSREPLAHETRGMLTRRVFGALTIATATALGLGVGTNPREVEATEMQFRGLGVETLELSSTLRQLAEETGRPLVLQINGGVVRSHRQEGLHFMIATGPEGPPSIALDVPQGNRTEEQMLSYGFQRTNREGNWRYGINMDDIESLAGQMPSNFMIVVERTIEEQDDGSQERVTNFFTVPAMSVNGPPIGRSMNAQPAYCIAHYPDRAAEENPIWRGRVLLYNRGDADPANIMAQR